MGGRLHVKCAVGEIRAVVGPSSKRRATKAPRTTRPAWSGKILQINQTDAPSFESCTTWRNCSQAFPCKPLAGQSLKWRGQEPACWGAPAVLDGPLQEITHLFRSVMAGSGLEITDSRLFYMVKFHAGTEATPTLRIGTPRTYLSMIKGCAGYAALWPV